MSFNSHMLPSPSFFLVVHLSSNSKWNETTFELEAAPSLPQYPLSPPRTLERLRLPMASRVFLVLRRRVSIAGRLLS